MKKLILLLTVITSLTYAEGLDIGNYLLVREGKHGLSDSKITEAKVYVENESKMICLDGWFNTPLKIEFEEKSQFTSLTPPDRRYSGAVMLYVFTGIKRGNDGVWYCTFVTINRPTSDARTNRFLLIPKAVESDNSEKK